MQIFGADTSEQEPASARTAAEWISRGHEAWPDLSDKTHPGIEAALQCFRNATEVDPESVDAHTLLGTVLSATGDLPAALAEFTRCVELAPDSPLTQYHFGVALEQSGRVAEAIPIFRKVVDAAPSFSWAYASLASVLQTEGDLQGAIDVLCELADVSPDSAWVHFRLATLYVASGLLDRAIPSFRRARELAPTEPAIRIDLARALTAQGADEEALQELREVVQDYPGHAEGWYTLGLALYHCCRATEALDALQTAARIEGHPEQVHYLLGAVHAELDDAAAATASLTRFLKTDPPEQLRLAAEDLLRSVGA